MTYLDAASTERLHPAAKAAFLAALAEDGADPARLHQPGRQARLHLDAAREQVATVLGARPDEVSFTPSGTQAVHLAVLGGLRGRARVGRGLVVSAVEHSAVLRTARLHDPTGEHTRVVPVDRTGAVSTTDLEAALRDAAPVALACLQSANHEVGTTQPVAEAAAACAEQGVPLFVDAAASAGRMPIPPGWSLLAASAHKWGGPLGVGVLAVRKGTRWRSPGPADDREGGRVPGRENIPAVVAAAAALTAVAAEAPAETARLRALVELLRARIPQLVADVEVVGDPVRRLPHVVTFSCLYVDGEALVIELDRAGFAVSSGSACTSSALTPSHVLEAMGVLTQGNVRVSLPWGTAERDVDRFLTVLPGVVSRLRDTAGVGKL